MFYYLQKAWPMIKAKADLWPATYKSL
jgi:hypothetical protein